MPGLAGMVRCAPAPAVAAELDALLAPMDRGAPLRVEKRVAGDGRWALARVHLGTLHPAAQLEGSGPLRVLFHGDLHNETELRAALRGRDDAAAGGDVCALLGGLYRRFGCALAGQLRGAYCAAIVDEESGRLLLLNDLLGSYPLYWHHGPRGVAFAGELKGLLRAPGVEGELDPRAVGDLLRFGFLLGDKTLAQGVALVPPAATLIFDWRTNTWRVQRHGHLADLLRTSWTETRAAYLEKVRACFNDAVAMALRGQHRFAMALSGGLDSRAILSAIDCAHTPLATFTLGVRGCADQVVAARLARLAGTAHRFMELDTHYLGEFLPNLRAMVRLTDGMYLSHGLTEMLGLALAGEAGYTLLLRGHGGELAKSDLAWPLHTDQAIWRMGGIRELIPYLLGRTRHVCNGLSPETLFEGEWREIVAAQPRRSLEDSLEGVDLSAPSACGYLYLAEHHRRFTVPSLELFRNRLEVRLPFCEQGFLSALLAGEPVWRRDTHIHKTITAGNARLLARVRNSNTGAPGNAPAYAERVMDKVNSLLKRMNVPGYRHYHDFGAWMAQRLVDSVEEVLLDRQACSRGMLREPVLRSLVRETRGGQADHGYLLQTLLLLELWQRERGG